MQVTAIAMVDGRPKRFDLGGINNTDDSGALASYALHTAKAMWPERQVTYVTVERD